jgi:hypothetical protein
MATATGRFTFRGQAPTTTCGAKNYFVVSANDSTGLVDAVCFQTASQKRLFKAFPEVILVDTTHGTNRNYYKLFSILVDDVFGKVMRLRMVFCTTSQLLYRKIPDVQFCCVLFVVGSMRPALTRGERNQGKLDFRFERVQGIEPCLGQYSCRGDGQGF